MTLTGIVSRWLQGQQHNWYEIKEEKMTNELIKLSGDHHFADITEKIQSRIWNS